MDFLHRYAYLADTLAATPAGITGAALRQIHGKVDAQAPATADQKRPPIRTFWHALYYPEQRRVKFSYYLRDDGDRIVRPDYQELRLETTETPVPSPVPSPSPEPPAAVPEKDAESPVVAKLRAAGATVQIERGEVVAIGFAKDSDPAPLLPLLRELPALHLVGFAETKITHDALAQLTALKRIDYVGLRDTAVNAGLAHLSRLTGITGINLSGTKITDAGLAHLRLMSRSDEAERQPHGGHPAGIGGGEEVSADLGAHRALTAPWEGVWGQ